MESGPWRGVGGQSGPISFPSKAETNSPSDSYMVSIRAGVILVEWDLDRAVPGQTERALRRIFVAQK
jgi:hypothetical protein